jgi:uncharacterized protein
VTAYLDSSGLVKLFLADEGGGDELLAALALLGVTTTGRLTYVETRAALAAARRVGRLSSADHDAVIGAMEAIWGGMVVLDLTEGIARDAGDLTETFGLRAGDAVQLATARAVESDDVVLVAWDQRLRTAAIAAGFSLYPPAI